MKIYIELLKKKDAKDLFTFELTNKSFFETMVPNRGSQYFEFEYFQKLLDDLLIEQADGDSYFYLIRNEEKEIVGRINLVDIDTENRSSSLGYRVGEKFTKRGVATAAVKLVLNVAKNNGITEIHAKTTANNLASQIVLEKSGFSSFQNEADTTSVELNGEHVNFLHFIWRNTSRLY
ncbi:MULTISPECIES: GNAT family N-acetyltransferase [Bacillus]|uniref:N-acetyltransferase n=2 Tax=Bacillus cereus group TaxID=86661 RepID=A0A2A7DA28_BACAN|nr:MULTISPECIES: GNAT family N-acetyltransferase [Bacillus]MCP1163872.1 GNAT family N-acetyltransferase [Bacillus sp. 1813sda1]MDC7975216.1 GNAT family N-acetyltransferase [Bacillus sp. BLCC-B18]OTW71599.1 GNAT family N-acetyltransferase [Bacillus thuringiensis serovar coreanensis]OTX55219.1 GNAT family N-acetyltransferase [Bacillus thuringiensis serovar sooncheon]OTX58556.1 GNAT family N-acetyltransferase [Bacillus thuringiensis serovar guiyangiensis]